MNEARKTKSGRHELRQDQGREADMPRIREPAHA